MLYIIGLGLGDEKDITLRGLEAVKSCDALFLEAYTSILPGISRIKLGEFYGKEIIEADRGLVETKAEELILERAKKETVGFLVVGDPFGRATTHSDIVVRARHMNINVEVIHNASIMNAIGVCGLQLYNFGMTVSIVFFTETWRPDSFYEKIEKNRKAGFHTLCLLDIKVKEPTMRAMMKGVEEYHPPRFMSVNTCIEQLLEVEENKKQNVYNGSTLCVGLARVGTSTQKIVSGTMKELLDVDFGEPLHSFIICSDEIHEMEKEYLEFYKVE
ncbi:diphthine methyl ester synthase [Acrasis kona]|uniref:diphthine methyl ester synthase n=1 Tax=Acrasis kona TaxID=1008807 RepID=A0AAW2ZRU8_9EUKA